MSETPPSVSTVLQARHSVRAFLPAPVPLQVLHEVFATALRVPSNCNIQPWRVYVVSGSQKEALAKALQAEAAGGKPPAPDFEWDVRFCGEHRERQFGAAAALYGVIGVDRHDRPARAAAMLRNWAFFDAPHAAFFTMQRYLQLVGAVDLGILAQTLALLLAERGIVSCMQGALAMYPAPVRNLLGLSDDVGILFGMSFGYADPDAAANSARTDRVALADAVRFIG